MILHIRCEATLEVPDGTTLRGSYSIQLPEGEVLKPWIIMECNDDEDLTTVDLENRGLFLEYTEMYVHVLPGQPTDEVEPA